MKIRGRRKATRIWPFRINWSGWRVTSVTCPILWWTIEWKAKR